jgi:competence ComEA-like helix-hairpin-helix protein
MKFTKAEHIFLLVIACLILVGGGFQLFYRQGELLLEVDPVLWAEANHRDADIDRHPTDTPAAIQETKDTASGDGGTSTPSDEAVPKVNINTASPLELTALPGIGPVLAGRIVDYRNERGPFLDGQQLLEVKGIGSRTLARMLPFVTVQDEGAVAHE